MEGMQCGLGLGEVAPSPPPPQSCAGPGWAGLRAVRALLWHTVGSFRPPGETLRCGRPGHLWVRGASGGVDGNQKWVIGPVISVKTRRTRKTRGPAESLPKILMQAGLQKRIATTNNMLTAVGNRWKLSEHTSPAALDVRLAVPPQPQLSLKRPNNSCVLCISRLPFLSSGILSTHLVSQSYFRTSCTTPTDERSPLLETELGEGNEKQTCHALPFPTRTMCTAFSSWAHNRVPA